MSILGLLLSVLIMPLSQVEGDTIRYTNDKGDYSLDIDSTATVQSQELEKGYVDIFIVQSPEAGFKYAITVTKQAKGDSDKETLKTQKYKEGFLSSCNCELVESYSQTFNEYEGMVFRISQVKNGKQYNSLIANAVQGESIYSISLYTLSDRFALYEDEFAKTIGTIELK